MILENIALFYTLLFILCPNSIRYLDTGFGKILNLEVLRARYGFYPGILEKYQRRLKQINYIVISLYAKGLSTQDISEQIEAIYFLSGINTEGKRDVSGFYINPTESSSFYNDIF